MFGRYKFFIFPTLVFILFLASFIILLQFTDGKYYTLERNLTQWDAQHYLSIARDGYEKFPCSYNNEYICGNIGWFPIYPLISGLLSVSDSYVNITMLIISWLSFWLSLIILYRMVSKRYGPNAALFSLLSLVAFPSSFYFLTAFPYSLYLLLSLTMFYLLDSKRYKYLFIFSALLTLTYPSGIVIGLPLTYYFIKNYNALQKTDRVYLLLSVLAIGIALAGYGLYYLIKFDDFYLYQKFQSQSYYAHEISIPFVIMIKALFNLDYSNPVWMTLALVIVSSVLFYSKKVKIEWMLFLLGVLLFTPTFGTTDCYYRHIVVAFPLFIMIGLAINDKYRKYFIPGYFVVSILLTWFVYLPAYKQGLLM